MSGLSKLYSCECEIVGCESNSNLLRYFAALESTEEHPQVLDVSNNYLGDKGAVALAKTMLGMQWLERVDLRNTGMREAAIAALASVLTTHRSIREVDLRGNETFAASGKLLVRAAQRNSNLRRILIDVHKLPQRITRHLCEVTGRNHAARDSYEDFQKRVRDLFQPACQAATLEDSKSAASDGDKKESIPHAVIVLEQDAQLMVSFRRCFAMYGDPIVRLLMDLGPIVLHLAGPGSHGTAHGKKFPDVTELAQTSRYRTASALSRRIDREMFINRSPTVVHQFSDLDEVLKMAEVDGLTEDARECLVQSRCGDILDRLQAEVTRQRLVGIPSLTSVEEEAQSAFRSIAKDCGSTEHRAVLLTCAKYRYLHQNSKADHQRWVSALSAIAPPLRIDSEAAERRLEDVAHSSFGQQRWSLRVEVEQHFPASFRQFLFEVAWQRMRLPASGANDGLLPSTVQSADSVGVLASLKSDEDLKGLGHEFAAWWRWKRLIHEPIVDAPLSLSDSFPGAPV